MGEFHFRYTYVAMLLFVSSVASGQENARLQDVYPSYTEDFHDSKTFPAVCFNDAWQDADGRVWLKTCSPVATDRLYLFEFDGYDFRLATQVLDTLSPFIELRKRLRDDVYVGFGIKNAETAVLAIADLRKKRITYHQWPAGQYNIGPACSDSSTISMLTIDPQSWVARTVHDSILTTRHLQIPPSSTFPAERKHEILFYDGNKIWWHITPVPVIYRMEISSGQLDSFTLSATLQTIPDVGHMSITRAGNTIYLSLWFKSREQLSRLNDAQTTFQEVSWPTGNWRYESVFGDKKGNTLFIAMTTDGSQHARLRTPDGRWLDYSAFVSGLGESRVQNVIGNDFTRELMICHDGGIVLHKVGITGAIRHTLEGYSIRAMTQLSNDEVLVTAQESGPFVLNLKTGNCVPFSNDCDLNARRFLRGENIQWIATNKGLYQANKDLSDCQPLVTEYGLISVLARVDSTTLAFVSNEGVIGVYHTKTRVVTTVTHGDHPVQILGRIHDAWCDHNRMLWIAASTGLWKINLINQQVDTLGHEPPFRDSRFLCIDPDPQGRLWLGTVVGGIHIYDPSTGKLKILDSDKGLANNTVVSIETDKEGVRWVGTYNGISLVSPDGTLISNLYVEDGLVDKENNRYASYVASNGEILVGTARGLNIIDGEAIKSTLKRKQNISIYLTAVSYTDRHGTQHKITRFEDLDHLKNFSLAANKRSLSVSVALSDYFNAGNHKYVYQLIGRDTGWRQIGNRHTIELEDLSAGNYTLAIRGSNSEGTPAINELDIPFRATAFFYEQWWFYVLCVVVIAGLVFLWIQRLRTEVVRATKEIRADKEIIEQQAEQLKELDEAKSHFFTNISHEFRTPLTIVSGMASQILENPQIWAEKGARMIKQSSNNLLNLVNQILDLRKLESSGMQLNMIHGNIIPYLQYLVDSFKHYAQSVEKQLRFECTIDILQMDYDPEKLMHIVSNLVSNAIRYTNAGDEIVVQAVHETGSPDQLIILVRDNGPGIAKEQLPHVFDRFFQAGKTSEMSGSSGIGLALTKELVMLMGGTIGVSSPVGGGTTFTIVLPIRQEATLQEMALPKVEPVIVKSSALDAEEDSTAQPGLPAVLVVEDNPDVMQVIVACLRPRYEVLTAADGGEGIDQAIEYVPDLIISDVMMPVKTGYQLCEILKRDQRTDHIPIILLTAKSEMDAKLTGLAYGADDYLTKPFEPKELLTRLGNLLRLRKALQERYTSMSTTSSTDADKSVPTPQDQFMSKLQEVVNAHVDDEQFGVTQLCREMTLGRTQLHQKIKALTGMSTTGYLRHIRLEKARTLLQTTEMNVSEVAYAVGFSDARYFSRLYQEKYGELPSRTRN